MSDFQNARPQSPSASNVYEFSPEDLVDKALRALQEAGVQLIEWKTLLYRRMGVPVILKVRSNDFALLFELSHPIYTTGLPLPRP